LSNGSRGVKLSCPECNEGLDGKLSFRGADKSAPDRYCCLKCNNEWFPDELKQEKYNTAVFKGDDGEWHFVAMTKARKENLKANSNMWKKANNPNQSRNTRGRFAGGMNERDISMLRRLKRK